MPGDRLRHVVAPRACARATDRATARIPARRHVFLGQRLESAFSKASLMPAAASSRRTEAPVQFRAPASIRRGPRSFLRRAPTGPLKNFWLHLQVRLLQKSTSLYLDAMFTYEGMIKVTGSGRPRVPQGFYERPAARAERDRREMLIGPYRRAVCSGATCSRDSGATRSEPCRSRDGRRTTSPTVRLQLMELVYAAGNTDLGPLAHRADPRPRVADALASRRSRRASRSSPPAEASVERDARDQFTKSCANSCPARAPRVAADRGLHLQVLSANVGSARTPPPVSAGGSCAHRHLHRRAPPMGAPVGWRCRPDRRRPGDARRWSGRAPRCGSFDKVSAVGSLAVLARALQRGVRLRAAAPQVRKHGGRQLGGGTSSPPCGRAISSTRRRAPTAPISPAAATGSSARTPISTACARIRCSRPSRRCTSRPDARLRRRPTPRSRSSKGSRYTRDLIRATAAPLGGDLARTQSSSRAGARTSTELLKWWEAEALPVEPDRPRRVQPPATGAPDWSSCAPSTPPSNGTAPPRSASRSAAMRTIRSRQLRTSIPPRWQTRRSRKPTLALATSMPSWQSTPARATRTRSRAPGSGSRACESSIPKAPGRARRCLRSSATGTPPPGGSWPNGCPPPLTTRRR